MTFKKLLIILSGIIAYLLFASLLGFYWAIRPPYKVISLATPEQVKIKYEKISFRTRDNVLIRGWFIPSVSPDAKTLIFLHGYPTDKGDIFAERYQYYKKYNVLFFDFRFLGESEGSFSTGGYDEILDVLAAIDYLKKRGIQEVGVWGLSMGGAVALMAAAQASEIKVVIAESAYARLDWMLQDYYTIPLLRYPLGILTGGWARLFLGRDAKNASPIQAAQQLKIPVLLVHSKQDKNVPFYHAEALQHALQHNPHAEFLFSNNLAHGELSVQQEEAIENFLDQNF